MTLTMIFSVSASAAGLSTWPGVIVRMARTSDSGMETASLGSDENHPSPTSPISPLGRCRRPVEDLPYELLSPASPSSGLGSTGTPATSPPPANITPVSGVLAKVLLLFGYSFRKFISCRSKYLNSNIARTFYC